MTYTLQLSLPDTQLPWRYPRVMDDGEFETFYRANPDLSMEREPDGTVQIMTAVTPNSGSRELELMTELNLYRRRVGGRSFSSNTLLRLPDTSIRMPDACHVSDAQVAKYTKEELDHIVELVPEFVAEVMSPTDRLTDAQEKMRDVWIANGVQLGWLIDVDNDSMWIYRADGTVTEVSPPDRVITGEDVLPGFEFDLALFT